VSLAVVLGIGVLGGAGAIGRFLLDGAVSSRAGSAFPYGTLAVNLLGALVLGVLTGAAVSADALRLAGTGFIGALTTFSTWMLESHRLAEDGEGRPGAVNLALSLALGLAIAALGRWVGEQL
jgi:fluoride exporter